MSTTSTLNSVLSALGGTTGFDVTSAVNAILYADRAPERGWQAQQTTLTNQTSAINQIENETSALSDSLNSLSNLNGSLSSVVASSSNSSLLTATAASGTASSNHTITINSLASAGSFYSDAEASGSTALSAGTVTITVGSGTPVDITIGGSGNPGTLEELAASINSQSLGVTANVITDASGARLALTSATTGTANDFTISSTDGLGFTRSGTGANASLTIDGVPISSASNTITGAIQGVTLNLLGAAPATTNSSGVVTSPATTINLSLGPDASSINSVVSDFVTAYNTLIKDLSSQVAYNAATQTAGVLQSDSAIQGLQSALLASTNYGSGSGVFQTLTSLGVTTNADGTLSLNSTTLAHAVQTNSAAVATFFQGDALNGFANSLTTSLNTYTDPSQGAFTVDLKSISNEYQALTDQTKTLEVYLSAQQTLLTAKYNAADIAIQQLPQKLKQIQALLNPNQDSNS